MSTHESSVAAHEDTSAAPEEPRERAPESGKRVKRLSRSTEIGRNIALHTVVIALILVSWQYTADHWVRPVWISSPTLVWERLRDLIDNGKLWANASATLQEALLGLGIGTVLGLVVGLGLHRFKLTGKIVWPYLMTGYAMPRIALAPFFVMWFGIGLQSKVLLVVSVVFFVVLFNVRQGLETVDPDHLDVMRSMRAGRFSTMRYVLIPTVVPWLVAGVKIAVGQALVSAVVAEMVGSTKGLGWFVVDSLNRFDMSGALTALVILVLLARGLYYILAIVESQLFRWRKESGTVDVP
jgi:NitT/TauT family transport system permease protein